MVTIWHRTPALGRGALVQDTSRVEVIERYNAPDTVQITGPRAELAPLMQPGHGACLVMPDGRLVSGRSVAWSRSSSPNAAVTVEADTGLAWRRLAYPQPGSAWSSQTIAYDRRTGAAETIALGYLSANLGQSALAARRMTGLTVPASDGRGASQTRTARFDVLGALVAAILEPDGLRWRIVQTSPDSPTLTVEVTQPAPVPPAQSLGIPGHGGPGLLREWSYDVARPEATVALVGAQGELAARTLRERVDATGALASWGRIEAFVDQRQTDDVTEMDKAGDDLLAGSQPMVKIATRIDDPLPVGSLVTVNLDGLPIVERVRSLTTVYTPTRIDYSTVIASTQGAELDMDQRRLLALDRQSRKVAAS